MEKTQDIIERQSGPVATMAVKAAPVEQKTDSLETMSLKATFNMTAKDLAALDETNPTAAASIRSQLTWATDAKVMFPGETEAEAKRTKHLDEMAEIDARNAAERAKLSEDQMAATKLSDTKARLAEIEDENAHAQSVLESNKAEAKALQTFLKGA